MLPFQFVPESKKSHGPVADSAQSFHDRPFVCTWLNTLFTFWWHRSGRLFRTSHGVYWPLVIPM